LLQVGNATCAWTSLSIVLDLSAAMALDSALQCQSKHSYTVSQKNCANLFLSELRLIYASFDNIWQKDGKEAKIMRDALIFHLT